IALTPHERALQCEPNCLNRRSCPVGPDGAENPAREITLTHVECGKPHSTGANRVFSTEGDFQLPARQLTPQACERDQRVRPRDPFRHLCFGFALVLWLSGSGQACLTTAPLFT